MRAQQGKEWGSPNQIIFPFSFTEDGFALCDQRRPPRNRQTRLVRPWPPEDELGSLVTVVLFNFWRRGFTILGAKKGDSFQVTKELNPSQEPPRLANL